MVLVWRITDIRQICQTPPSPNFPAIYGTFFVTIDTVQSVALMVAKRLLTPIGGKSVTEASQSVLTPTMIT